MSVEKIKGELNTHLAFYGDNPVIIDSVNIEGFWGNKKANAKFNQDVTIFIGLNGTGKTTFVNLIAAAISVDVSQLSNFQFDSISIKLIDRKDKRKRKTITISRQQYNENPALDIYNYQIGSNHYQIITEARILKNINKNRQSVSRSFLIHTREQSIKLKQYLGDLLELSQISVYRQSHNQNLDNDPRQRLSDVDERLKQLLERFARYQLKLETKLNEISKKFQQQTVSSLLYNQEFDKLVANKSELKKIDLQKLSKDLYAAFSELGIKDKTNNIEVHIEHIGKSIARLQEQGFSNVDDVLALPLIYRTNHIINSLTNSEEEKKQITKSRQEFFKILQQFMIGKSFHYDNKSGEFSFSLDEDTFNSFPWSNLSSGEKQLLIQFLEVLLQESKSVIFIADEPEISLHVKWQENLLSAIRGLNENAQLIIATHSPDIVADFGDKVIDMEEVIVA